MMIDPTPEQADQCAIVQQEVLETIDRLLIEGIDGRVVLAGLGSAIASTVIRVHGSAEVPIWFARLSAMTMHFAKEGA